MNDIDYMNEALKEAYKSYKRKDVPVGCVIVYKDKIIARAHNTRFKTKSPLGHAEVTAIKKATKKLKCWMLDDCTLYVTLEPCLMCSGLIMQSRIKRVVFGAYEPKFGTMGSILNITNDEYKFNHHIEVTPLVLEKESSDLLKTFFKDLRKAKKS